MTEINSEEIWRDLDNDRSYKITPEVADLQTVLPIKSSFAMDPLEYIVNLGLNENRYRSQIDDLEDEIVSLHNKKEFSEKETARFKSKLDAVLNFCNELLSKPLPKSYHNNPFGLMEKEYLLDQISKIIKSQ